MQDAPFFVTKLQVKVLPCLLVLINGVAVDRIVGFDPLGAKDDFSTSVLETKLLKAGVIQRPIKRDSDSDAEDVPVSRSLRIGGVQDEDSDFD